MERDYFDIAYSVLFSIVSGIMAIFFLGIGLRALLTKRPFLVSNGWFLSLIILVGVFNIVVSFRALSSDILSWFPLLLMGVVLLMMCYQLRGYAAYAVTDARGTRFAKR